MYFKEAEDPAEDDTEDDEEGSADGSEVCIKSTGMKNGVRNNREN
jgi:hypothetical protein